MDQGRLTLFFYILMRMSGFVVFSPVFGRQGVPGIVRAGLSLLLSVTAAAFTVGTAAVPPGLLVFALKLLLELALGYLLGLGMQLFFYIPQLAGEIIDTQMGMTMSKTYDAGSQISMTVTTSFLNILMMLLFFVANGHYTLLRIMLTSGEIVPYGAAALGLAVPEALVEIFVECTVLGVKLALPILAAELMGQVGMGILMKVIPQINVFAINIELKVIIGLILLLLLIAPFSSFLLDAENQMLAYLQRLLALAQ